jgi:hypothetical protein
MRAIRDRGGARRRRQYRDGGDLGHGCQQRRHHGADHHLEDTGTGRHRCQHGTTVRATFSEAMNAATITSTTFVLRNAAGTTLGATVGCNAGTLIATLTPPPPWQPARPIRPRSPAEAPA